jgi:soluble lytic murein transglycosylase
LLGKFVERPRANRRIEKLSLRRLTGAMTLAGAMLWTVSVMLAAQTATPVHKKHAPVSAASHQTAAKGKAVGGKRRPVSHARRKHRPRKPLSRKALAKSHKLKQAFVASAQLRPMAQQLAQNRTPAAYTGVSGYARNHTGEAGAAAYLALGHAYLLDRNFPQAVSSFQKSGELGESLDDYAEYLAAQADLQAGKLPEAELLLNGFEKRHPDSIFITSTPVLEANLFLQEGDPQAALLTLKNHQNEAIASHADFQLAQAKALQLAGQTDQAAKLFRHVFLGFPLSVEAQQAKIQLAQNSAAAPLTVTERRTHADALYAAGRYSDAEEEYRSLASDPSEGDQSVRNALLVAAASCDWKLKRLSKDELDRLQDSPDEAGARRMYLYMELARNKDDGETQRSIVLQMETRSPNSPWLAEALYSSGNMYLLRKDYAQAIQYYGELARRFPRHTYAPSSHWRAAWLNYRLANYSEAARLFDEQIAQYPGGKEIPGALYWRGRVYGEQEKQPQMAAAYFSAVARVYQHFYYAAQARQQLAKLGNVSPTPVAMLANMQPETIPTLTDDVPEDDPHVVKAKLLANAGLNEYIAPEIRAADGSDEWGAFAEAEIYVSYGENFHAMRLMKRAMPFYTSAPIEAIPMTYWRILFPQSYWGDIKAEAAKNGLDPYMVASLIRQETEFNANAISNKNAYGLMQLLPSVGKSMAKEEGNRHLEANQLLDPSTNIRLGTRYLKQTLDKFGGQPEYAFAAYNAGDDRVLDWQSVGNYHGIDEFVESIPFTETREYVQAIIRNEEIYRELDRASVRSSTGEEKPTPTL